MARIRTRSQFNFDSAARQLDSRDLDTITDPTTDLGGAVADAVGEYADAGTDLQPEYPGFDIYSAQITEGGYALDGSDFGLLAPEMVRATGYEDYPAELPYLGEWSAPSDYKVRWTPNEPGIYQWYAATEVELNTTPHADTWVGFRQGLPAIIDETWGADAIRQGPTDGEIFRGASQGMLMASEEMLDAGWGGLNFFGPYLNIGGAETLYRYTLTVVILTWSPGGTVPYLDGI